MPKADLESPYHTSTHASSQLVKPDIKTPNCPFLKPSDPCSNCKCPAGKCVDFVF